MARNLRVGIQRGLRQSIGGGFGTGDVFTLSPASFDFSRTNTKDSRITFTRASSGTFVGADGLIKTTPVNFALNSNSVQGSSLGTSILNSTENVISPRGITETVRRLGRDVSAGGAQIWRVGSTSGGTPNTTYTISFYAKTVNGGTTSINIDINDAAPSSGQAATITGEWTRIVKTGGSRPNNLRFFDMNMVTATEDFYVWGAQIEIGTVVTDYIPTGSTISGAPRFNHDPVTGESLGLLIEESRTNKVFYSQDLTTGGGDRWRLGDGGYTQQNSNFPLAPDGVSRMWLVNLNSTSGTTNNGSRIYTANQTFGSNTNVFSFYARSVSGTGNFPAAYFNGSDYIKIYISLTTNTKRYTIYIPPNTGGHIVGFSRRGTTHDETLTQAYVWGCQCEEGDFVTSYIPTFGSQVTRAADIVDITGTNFSSFYNSDSNQLGTMFVDAGTSNPNNFDIVEISNGNIQTRDTIRHNVNDGVTALTSVGGGANSQQYVTTGTVSIRAAANSVRGFAVNGTSTTDAGNQINNNSAMTQLAFGRRATSSNTEVLNGHIKRFVYFPENLDVNTLKSITS